MTRRPRTLVAGCLALGLLGASDTIAKRYRVGDSIEFTREVEISIWSEPGDATAPPQRVLILNEVNTLDIETVRTVESVRWLKVRVFKRKIGDGYESYKTIGRGWTSADLLRDVTRREDTSWTGTIPAAPKPKPKPKPKFNPRARVSIPPRPGLVTPPQAGAPNEPAESLPAGPKFTAEEGKRLTELFTKLHGDAIKAVVVTQGNTIGLVVKVKTETPEAEAKKLATQYLNFFRQYKYHYRISVVGTGGKSIVKGSKSATESEIQW